MQTFGPLCGVWFYTLANKKSTLKRVAHQTCNTINDLVQGSPTDGPGSISGPPEALVQTPKHHA